MPGPLDDLHIFLPGTDLLHLAQGGAGHHEGELLLPLLVGHLLPAQGQPVAVHRHHRQAVPLHLEEGAGVDRPAFVVADGKEGLGDHGPQGGLSDGQGVLLLHGGQLRELLRVGAQDVELGQAALDIDRVALGGEDHHVVGHICGRSRTNSRADSTREPVSRISRRDGGPDAGLQVIAGQPQLIPPPSMRDALHGGGWSSWRPPPGRPTAHRSGEQGLFAGKFHVHSSSLSLSPQERRGLKFVTVVRRENFCGKKAQRPLAVRERAPQGTVEKKGEKWETGGKRKVFHMAPCGFHRRMWIFPALLTTAPRFWCHAAAAPHASALRGVTLRLFATRGFPPTRDTNIRACGPP